MVGIAMTLPASTMAESFLSEADVKYRGDLTARQICRAVVDDDVQGLEFGLKQIRRDALASYMFNERSDAIVRSVSCNGMELLTFADEIGARSISNYLGEGTVTIEEVVVTGQR